jgi:hypothetical protein
MKAIINIKNKKNQYSKFNGLTFEVKESLSYGFGLLGVNSEFPNAQTDFNFNEVIIVDVKQELRQLQISGNTAGWIFCKSKWDCLMSYCKINKIDITPDFIQE